MDTLERYLSRLASSDPTPGGGSAATLVASAGAALVSMVARLSAANPKYAAHHAAAGRVASAADKILQDLSLARERDEQAYGLVVEAQAMPKATEAQKADRQRSIEAALAHAAEEPLKAAALSLDVLHLSKQLLDIQNTNLASDIGCAAEFAFAAIVGSGYNVRINHRFMRDDALILKQAKLLNRFEQEGGQVVTYVRHAIGNAMRKERPAAAPK